MKKTITMSLAALMLLTLCACGPEQVETTTPTTIGGFIQIENHENQIRDFYEEFIQLDLTDPARAIEEYVYYNDEAIKSIAIDSVEGNYTTHYEILGLEKITDQLWAIELYIETSMDPEGFTAYNFVGEIDGAYKIMRSVNQIPQPLIGDLNLDAYLPTGEYIDPEDVIIDTPIRK